MNSTISQGPGRNENGKTLSYLFSNECNDTLIPISCYSLGPLSYAIEQTDYISPPYHVRHWLR